MGIKTTLKEKFRDNGGQAGLGKLIHAKAIWDFAKDGGAVATIVPKQNVFLPKNAVIVGGTINSVTNAVSGGGGTMEFGTSAGSSSTSILGATNAGALAAGALIDSAAKFSAPVKLTARGYLTAKILNAVFTAGRVEINVFYFVAKS